MDEWQDWPRHQRIRQVMPRPVRISGHQYGYRGWFHGMTQTDDGFRAIVESDSGNVKLEEPYLMDFLDVN